MKHFFIILSWKTNQNKNNTISWRCLLSAWNFYFFHKRSFFYFMVAFIIVFFSRYSAVFFFIFYLLSHRFLLFCQWFIKKILKNNQLKVKKEISRNTKKRSHVINCNRLRYTLLTLNVSFRLIKVGCI